MKEFHKDPKGLDWQAEQIFPEGWKTISRTVKMKSPLEA